MHDVSITDAAQSSALGVENENRKCRKQCLRKEKSTHTALNIADEDVESNDQSLALLYARTRVPDFADADEV